MSESSHPVPEKAPVWPWRGLAIGVVLAPLCSYWALEWPIWGASSSGAALSAHLTSILFYLVLVNLALRRFANRFALGAHDLLFAWIIPALAAAYTGVVVWIFPAVGHPFLFASPENQWRERLWPHLPTWLTVRNPEEVAHFYQGHASILQPGALKAWLLPLGMWALFLSVLFLVTLCLVALLRKQWSEHEHYSYPLMEVPLALMRHGGDLSLLRSPLLWAGAGLAGGLCLWNGLAFLYPEMPRINTKLHEISQHLPFPWNAMGWTVLGFHPVAIGLAYFLPTDLAFSVWFFFIIRKLQPVMFTIAGWEWAGGYYGSQVSQNVGGLLGLFAVILWTAHGHLRNAVRHALRPRTPAYDAGEAVPYRLAFAAILLGCLFLVSFLVAAGMAPWVAVCYLGIYLALATAAAQIRAQIGPPDHAHYAVGPNFTLITLAGSRSFTPDTLGVFSLLGFMTWFPGGLAYSQVDALRLADRTGFRLRSVGLVLACALPLGAVLAFLVTLAAAYRDGSPYDWWASVGSNNLYNYFDSWTRTPTGPNVQTALFIGGGFLFTLLLGMARLRFLWWPLHPAGYVLGMSLGTDYVWMQIFLAWLLKTVLLRAGGLRSYRRVAPFFVGLVVGEYLVGTAWGLLSILLHQRMYSFYPF